jgi:hypothetical protein
MDQHPSVMAASKMTKRRTAKIIITGALIVSAAGCKFFLGYGIAAFILFVCALATYFWWFALQAPPKDEQPCAMVSCCHYLGNRDSEP